jgi:hypothetical protein
MMMRQTLLAWALALALLTAPVAAQTAMVPPDRLGGAWTPYTPVATANTGTVTTWGTHVGRYQRIGKTVNFAVIIRITSNGTGSGYVSVTLPVTPRAGWRGGCSGWRGDNSSILGGFIYSDFGTSILAIFAANSLYPGADGAELWMNCTYEAA